MKKKHIDFRNAFKAAGGALVVLLLSMAAVSGGPLAHGTPAERLKLSVIAAEVGKEEKPSQPPERLFGTWTAKDVDAKMGEVKILLTFRREKKATLLAWSDILFVGQVRDLKGAFSVHDDTISSEAIRDGKKAKFSFENDQLVLRFKSGNVVRFDRDSGRLKPRKWAWPRRAAFDKAEDNEQKIMKIQINTDINIAGRDELAEQAEASAEKLKRSLDHTLGRLSDR